MNSSGFQLKRRRMRFSCLVLGLQPGCTGCGLNLEPATQLLIKGINIEHNHLGKSLQLLMDRVDEMSQDIVKYNTYLRNVSKQQQQKHQYQQRRQQENLQRQSRGEAPLPEEDINKLFKPPQPPARMESLLIAGQINTYCQNIKEFNAQNLGKLFMAQALQDYNN